jgi:hypothetical protein
MSSPNIDLKTLLNLLSVVKKINLGFLKNNLALLVPIGIALVAILMFVPTTLLSGKLRKQIDEQSVKASREIDTLIREVNEAVQAEALEPYIKAYEQDAKDMNDLIVHSTMRELLDYKVFADPNQTSQLVFDPFRQKFLAGVETMLKNLKAGAPPTDVEINAALESSSPWRSASGRNRMSMGMGMGRTGNTQGQFNRGWSFRRMNDTDRKIVEKVCEDRAKGIKAYANPVDLSGYVYWSDWKFEDWDKATRDAWYWQMAYWMLEDVVATVQAMNQEADHVLNSPVKRIMSVQFTQSRAGRSMIGRGRRTVVPKDKQTPNYVTSIRNAMAGSPCTGRFSSSDPAATMDVMHFEVTVVVRAAEVMHFMQELCSAKTHKFRGWYGDQPEQTYKHNQISILESTITPVDREDFDHSGFQYGEDEVVSVDLICEYLFYVPAYAKIQPKIIGEDITASVSGAGMRK